MYVAPRLYPRKDILLDEKTSNVNVKFFHLQASQRAITDIDRRVKKISGAARKYYSTTELSPFLDDLDQSTEETLQLMDNLSLSLRCEPIFRQAF